MIVPDTPYSGLARVYDALMGDRYFAHAQRNFERLCQSHLLRPQSSADAACGTGSFVRYLCGLGLRRVFGVDSSADMLAVAIEKNRGNQARFFCQDLQAFRLPECVDCITCHADSLNYLLSAGDLLRVLRLFHTNLVPGGTLIFDMLTPRQSWAGNQPLEEQRLWPGGGFWRSIHLDPQTGLQNSQVEICLDGRTYHESHRQRAYPWQMIVLLASLAGFHLLAARDFDTWQPANAQTRRMVVAAQKPVS